MNTPIHKLQRTCLFVFLIGLSGIMFSSCAKTCEDEPEPGQSLGIASIPNLRDVGGYKTKDGSTVVRELVYRSNQLYKISESDMIKLAQLNLKYDFDLRTEEERNAKPDELPVGVKNVWLDVMASNPGDGPAVLAQLLQNPVLANAKLGDGKVDLMFMDSYRKFVSMPSALIAFRELFLSLGDQNQLPALFHCTTGKDRTGLAAAVLLTLLEVPVDTVMKDYLRSNDYILPMYKTVIDDFVAAGGQASIPQSIYGVKEEYLNAAFDELTTKYITIERYFSEGLGINTAQQQAIKDLYLTKK
jgi:protein-tyrosine phosphatase